MSARAWQRRKMKPPYNTGAAQARIRRTDSKLRRVRRKRPSEQGWGFSEAYIFDEIQAWGSPNVDVLGNLRRERAKMVL